MFYGNNYLELSRVVIVDIDNKKIKPISIIAQPEYDTPPRSIQTGDKDIVFDGTLSERPFPYIYHSGDWINARFEILIPPTIIKYIIIYGRSDYQSPRDYTHPGRLSFFTLKLRSAPNVSLNWSIDLVEDTPSNIIASVQLSGVGASEAYRLTDSWLVKVDVATAVNEIQS